METLNMRAPEAAHASIDECSWPQSVVFPAPGRPQQQTNIQAARSWTSMRLLLFFYDMTGWPTLLWLHLH